MLTNLKKVLIYIMMKKQYLYHIIMIILHNRKIKIGGNIIMLRKTVSIPSLEAAKSFVNFTSKYDEVPMRLRVNDYEVDAHSIVGVLSIVDTHCAAEFTAKTDEDNSDMLNDIKPFLA